MAAKPEDAHDHRRQHCRHRKQRCRAKGLVIGTASRSRTTASPSQDTLIVRRTGNRQAEKKHCLVKDSATLVRIVCGK